MMMKNKMIRALGLSAVAVGLNIGVANAEIIVGNAQVIVLSTIAITEDASLDFGTIAAFSDARAAGSHTAFEQAVLTIPAAGTAPIVTATVGTLGVQSNIVSIVDGSPGIFSVTGAAPNTVLTIDVTTPGTGLLTDPSGVSNRNFVLVAAGIYMTLNGSGNTFTEDTDATGALTFQVGGSITTTLTNAAVGNLVAYPDALYTGTYQVEITY